MRANRITILYRIIILLYIQGQMLVGTACRGQPYK